MIAFGERAFCELPPEYDLSVPSQFAALLANPDAQFVHLVELYPYDDALPGTLIGMPPFGAAAFCEFDVPMGGGISRVYLSDIGFTTKPTDTLPNRHYKALIDNPVQYETSIMSSGEFENGSVSYGSLVISNGDGELDELSGFVWSGSRAVVKVGTKDFPYAQFATVFDGIVNDYSPDDERITITIQDKRNRTDQYLATTAYLGTGGLEGGESLQGRPKPLCFGEVRNIEPVLVDPANLIYQVHDGSILGISVLRDSGAALTDGGDVADITAASVSAGQFKTQNSGGYIKLGSTPAGRITADVQGSNAGGYVSTPGAIVQRVVSTRLASRPFLTTEIDGGAFARIDEAVGGPSGFYVSDYVTASEVIDAQLLPVLAYWSFSRQGMLTGGLITPPGVPTLQITDDVIDMEGPERVSTIVPTWRVSVGYCPLGIVQGEDELAGGVTDEDRANLGTQFRFVTAEQQSIRGNHHQAMERTFLTRLTGKAQAEALLERLEDIFMTRRSVYRVPVRNALYRTYLGATVRLIYPRHDLKDGVNLHVVSVSEDAETGQTVLGLWG